jgi:hypothetical protein
VTASTFGRVLSVVAALMAVAAVVNGQWLAAGVGLVGVGVGVVVARS